MSAWATVCNASWAKCFTLASSRHATALYGLIISLEEGSNPFFASSQNRSYRVCVCVCLYSIPQIQQEQERANRITQALSCPFNADYSSSLYRNDPSRLLAVLMPHFYQQSNISAVLSEHIRSCIVPFPSSGIWTNDPILPGTKRSGRTGGEDCGKREGRGIISGMTSVLNHSRLALSARVSER